MKMMILIEYFVSNLKMKIITLCIFSTILLISSCASQKSNVKSAGLKLEIDTYINNVIVLHNIPGLSLAVIDKNGVVYKGYFGKSSIEENINVDKNTIFRLFSTTKLITSTGIFQLVQDKFISLDDEISLYLDNLPSSWQRIKVENLLSHSSGLPDLIRYKSDLSDNELLEKLAKAEMNFEIGNQFRYNQTNYWLLSKIIEQVTGLTFEQFIIRNQFNNNKNGVLFSSNSQENIANRATRYYYNGKTKKFVKDTLNVGKRGHSGNGLNITLDRLIKWNQDFDNNKLIDQYTKEKMLSPFHFLNLTDKFSHGWGYYRVNELNSHGFSGGNLAAFRKFEKNNITVILLSNGYQLPAFDIVINDVARMVIPELKERHRVLEEDVMASVLSARYDTASTLFKTLVQENPLLNLDNLNWNINAIGNAFIQNKEIDKALQIFRFNADINPDWWVALAGLAEIYEIMGDAQKAIVNYQNAVALNENNELNYNNTMNFKILELKKGELDVTNDKY